MMRASPVFLTMPVPETVRVERGVFPPLPVSPRTSQLSTGSTPPLVTMMLPGMPLFPAQASLTWGTVLVITAVLLVTSATAQALALLGTTPAAQLAAVFQSPNAGPIQPSAQAEGWERSPVTAI